MALLGFLFTLILNELERWIIPWKEERRQHVLFEDMHAMREFERFFLAVP